jgi:DNA-binding MarR family transcriptional regulator
MEDFTKLWCFRISALSRRISRSYNNQCLKFGITASQSFVIFDLLANEGSSVKDIALHIQLDSPAVTGLIDRLLKEELVERKEDPSDRRSLQVYLTAKGRKLAEDLRPVGIEYNQYIRDIFTPDEEESFEKCLSKLESKL